MSLVLWNENETVFYNHFYVVQWETRQEMRPTFSSKLWYESALSLERNKQTCLSLGFFDVFFLDAMMLCFSVTGVLSLLPPVQALDSYFTRRWGVSSSNNLGNCKGLISSVYSFWDCLFLLGNSQCVKSWIFPVNKLTPSSSQTPFSLLWDVGHSRVWEGS